MLLLLTPVSWKAAQELLKQQMSKNKQHSALDKHKTYEKTPSFCLMLWLVQPAQEFGSKAEDLL